MSLVDAYNLYATAGPGERGQALSQLLAIARSRHDQLAALVQTDAAETLRVVLPASLRANFPDEAAQYLEHDVQYDGELTVYHVDHVNPTANHYIYNLKTTRGPLPLALSLRFADDEPPLVTGTKVRVTGVQIDNTLALGPSGGSVVTQAAAALPNTLGAQKTLTMLVNFTDNRSQPYSVADAQASCSTRPAISITRLHISRRG